MQIWKETYEGKSLIVRIFFLFLHLETNLFSSFLNIEKYTGLSYLLKRTQIWKETHEGKSLIIYFFMFLHLEIDLFSSFLNIEKYILVFFHVSSFRDRSIFFFFEYWKIYWPVLSLVVSLFTFLHLETDLFSSFLNIERNTHIGLS